MAPTRAPSDLDLGPPTFVGADELGLPTRKRGRARVRQYERVGPIPPRPRLAIVGSRAAHRGCLAALAPMLTLASARGWSLVSGGALGIDAGAHRAALALGQAQLAVLPCGRDRPYPPQHLELFAAMAASPRAGLLFAQPRGTRPSRGMFASRNAIVVGLADAVLVAEAGLRSGSIGTGRLAMGRGVPIAAIAGSPGCGALIGAGARALPAVGIVGASEDPHALLLAGFERWLDALAGTGGHDPEPDPDHVWPAELAWLASAITAAGPTGLALDSLPDPAAASLAVLEAELLGLVCEGPAGRWLRVL